MRPRRIPFSLFSLLFTLPLCGTGCGAKIQLAEPGQYLRLAEDVDAKVMVRSGPGQWATGANKVRIPALSYVLPATAATQPSK